MSSPPPSSHRARSHFWFSDSISGVFSSQPQISSFILVRAPSESLSHLSLPDFSSYKLYLHITHIYILSPKPKLQFPLNIAYQFLINSTALSNFHCFCFFCFTLFSSVLGFTLLTPSPPNSFAHFEAPTFLLSQSQSPRSQSLGLLLSCLLTRHPKFFLHCNHCNCSLPTPLTSPSLLLPLTL